METAVRIKRLAECALTEAVEAWNKGFEDYYVKAETNPDAFIARMTMEGLSPTLSLVAYFGSQPVGLLLSGIRTLGGQTVSWNGGTAVAAAFRRHGIAKQLLLEAHRIYREEGVHTATLEAIAQNERAIRLYEQLGYGITDRVAIMESSSPSPWSPCTVGSSAAEAITFTKARPQEVSLLAMYNAGAAWQTQWLSVRDGEAVIARDAQGEPMGYALFRRAFDAVGKHVSTTLFQCETHPQAEDRRGLTELLLNHVFEPGSTVRKRTFNISTAGECAALLQAAGFETMTEQVRMQLVLAEAPSV
ncbi:GNAT family N-acetyltransferase [Paenibacillus cremeus]|uniref:GNAT family N-acetyltransferase n=1 Tax=Paenibacillus cremeus TaxID=2163881 RepID=A0A559KC71_9BACL|nr:GNAT family N-acetyltransferase [Paenibacillus cremeus]TVY09703.1 GNAT family N-acetyltransferase [Paenibacillus cremeus]